MYMSTDLQAKEKRENQGVSDTCRFRPLEGMREWPCSLKEMDLESYEEREDGLENRRKVLHEDGSFGCRIVGAVPLERAPEAEFVFLFCFFFFF